MAIDLRLARKGANEPRIGLIQQGRYHAKLAADKADELQRAGWKKEKTALLSSDLATLESQSAAQSDRRSTAKSATLTESAARNQAKSFIRKLRNALPIVLRDHPDVGVTASQFEGGTLGQSTPKVSNYLNQITEPIKKLDEPLKDYFDQASASEQLATLKKLLDAADTAQETSLAGLPEETLKLYETKGRVLQAIEDINRLAKNAFDGQAALVSQFNKDILLRARQTRKSDETDFLDDA
jgi:hypothetical protein